MPAPSANHPSLTESRLARLKNQTPGKDLFVRDTDLRGFGIRISSRNVKSFFVEATVRGRFFRRVLGRHPIMTLTDARNAALETLRALRCSELACSSKQPQGSLQCLSYLVEEFLVNRAPTLRESTVSDYRRILTGCYFSDWRSLPVKQISRSAVLDRYRQMCIENGVGMANRAMRVLGALFNYGRAVHPQFADWANPVAVLRDARARIPLRPRQSHVPLTALKEWLVSLDSYRDNHRSKCEKDRRQGIWLLLHLLIMTGLRSNEARSLQWEDLDLPSGVLTIKGTIAKNGRPARLPVNEWLAGLLAQRKGHQEAGFVFCDQTHCGYINNLKRPLEALHRLSGTRVTPHDLRRTFATYLDHAGTPFGAIKQLLNHVSNGDVTAQYVQK